jgi:hypothetical protein
MFIEDIGSDYADENLCGALFMYNGRVHRVMAIDGRSVRAYNVDSEQDVEIPASEVTGWRTFKYPRLGYRRIDEHTVALVTRSPRSYTRGLCYENVIIALSESSKQWQLNNVMDHVDLPEVDYYYKDNKWSDVCKAAMDPAYDDKDQYARFVNKEISSFVPNYNFMMDRVGNNTNIYLAGHHIGYINRGGKIVTAPKNLSYINNIVRTYAAA